MIGLIFFGCVFVWRSNNQWDVFNQNETPYIVLDLTGILVHIEHHPKSSIIIDQLRIT